MTAPDQRRATAGRRRWRWGGALIALASRWLALAAVEPARRGPGRPAPATTR